MKKIWKMPATLDLPLPPKGYIYRWLRTDWLRIKNKKIKKKKKFKPVRLKDLKNKKLYPSINLGRWGKCVGIGGLLLVKIRI